MSKNSLVLLEGIEKFRKENKKLQKQLLEATGSVDAIKAGKIDALILTDKKGIKVYSEKTADKTYRILIERMHEGAITLNAEGAILFCNSSFARMVNLPLEKVIGTKFKEFIKDSSKGNLQTLFKRSTEETIREEIYIYPRDGKAIPVMMSAKILMLDDSLALSLILTDLTIQNKNREELNLRSILLQQKNAELEGANKNLTTFTYVSSHDLQEPLRKIKNFVTLLLEEEQKNLSRTGKNYLQRTYEIAERMQELIEDLLTYSRTMNPERSFEKTNLTIIVEEIKQEFEEVMQEKKATIEATHLGEASIIRFQFHQLFQNLISNSLKFSRSRIAPKIKITSEMVRGDKINLEKLSSARKYCHITYTDNGIGFEPEYNDRIFQVFQRLHLKDEYPGTGMGLAICKRIVENHDGIITATGALNKGARFDIYIPVA